MSEVRFDEDCSVAERIRRGGGGGQGVGFFGRAYVRAMWRAGSVCDGLTSSLFSPISDSFKIACDFQWDQVAEVKHEATAIHLYRIAQEAVSNAIKHGKARRSKLASPVNQKASP